jgi:formylglycine-generating enzyme required for sulfatase activity
MSPGDAGELLARAIRQVDDRPVTPQEALETAKDLHVLWLDQDKIRFTHPSVQHLFAAIGCTLEELAGLAEQERERALQDGADPAPAAPPSYAHHRYDELFQFAAQRRGVEVPDRLLAVDPVLAARVFIAIGRDVPDDAIRDRIVASLRAQLDKIFVPPVRAGILAALGDLGWSLPAAGEGGRGATMLVPGRRWTLGRPADPATDERNVHSEARDIELAPFRIARFPVSNAEYATFVEDGGYEDQSLWPPEGWEWRTRQRAQQKFVAGWQRRQARLQRDHPARTIQLLREGKATPAGAAALVRFAKMTEGEMFAYARALQEQPLTAPRFWQRKPLRNRLQPVVGVSWFEANAFCAWLSRRIGAVVRLPSESEWEAACLHSWGVTGTTEIDDKLVPGFANTRDRQWSATTPIGAFATLSQARRNLAVEMLGNVFEWVFDYYSPGDHNRRIVKGGSWRHDNWRAHPAYRGRGDVDSQNEDLGFRYVIAEGLA